MKTVPLLSARINLDMLSRRVERGETIVITEGGKPVLDLVPHRKSKAAMYFKRKRK